MIYKIAVIGQQCSGKTTAAKFFAQKFDIKKFVKIADPIYDTLKALRQEKHRAFMQQFADLAKEHFGEEILVEIFKQNVLEIENSYRNMFADTLIVCDDIRFPYELKTVQDELGFIMIAIDAPAEVRKVRAEKLGLQFIENHNSELLVPQLIPQADYIIKDNGISMDELKEEVEWIYSDISVST